MPKLIEPPGAEIPTEDESRIARESSELLARHLEPGHDLRVRFLDNGSPGEELVLPKKVGRLLTYILGQIARGYAVQVFPLGAELTTKQAANFLNVSRPHVIKEIEAGRIPCHMVGTHRRITLRDLVAYKKQVDAGREKALEELARLTQELGEDD
jgi:excisionase family DNA binding protein